MGRYRFDESIERPSAARTFHQALKKYREEAGDPIGPSLVPFGGPRGLMSRLRAPILVLLGGAGAIGLAGLLWSGRRSKLRKQLNHEVAA